MIIKTTTTHSATSSLGAVAAVDAVVMGIDPPRDSCSMRLTEYTSLYQGMWEYRCEAAKESTLVYVALTVLNYRMRPFFYVVRNAKKVHEIRMRYMCI